MQMSSNVSDECTPRMVYPPVAYTTVGRSQAANTWERSNASAERTKQSAIPWSEHSTFGEKLAERYGLRSNRQLFPVCYTHRVSTVAQLANPPLGMQAHLGQRMLDQR